MIQPPTSAPPIPSRMSPTTPLPPPIILPVTQPAIRPTIIHHSNCICSPSWGEQERNPAAVLNLDEPCPGEFVSPIGELQAARGRVRGSPFLAANKFRARPA